MIRPAAQHAAELPLSDSAMALCAEYEEAADDDVEFFVEAVSAAIHQYEVRLGGTLDGANTRDPVGYGNYGQTFENNLFLCLENVGDALVHNPWVIVNGARDWRSLERILSPLLRDDMSEADRALAVWEFARRHRYHSTTADDEVKDTVKMLNAYGYTLCWDEAFTVSNLWQAAGLKIRRGLPHGHCTTEVFFDGAYHLLDSDEHLLVLEGDNETIAAEAALSRDHDLMKRSHAYGILSPENRRTSESAASLFCHTGPRAGSRPLIGDHVMRLDLRPGEALVWEWGQRGKYHGYGQAPPRYCNGRLRYRPRLDTAFAEWAEVTAGLESWTAPGGDSQLRPTDTAAESSIIYRFQTPYPMVGGRLAVLPAEGAESTAAVEFCREGTAWTSVAAADSQVEDSGELYVDLDHCLPPDSPACYDCRVRLQGRHLHIAGLSFEWDLQMAPLSLPALEVGDNTVVYSDDGEAGRGVVITHGWRERDSQPPPRAPLLTSPVSADAVVGTLVEFVWEPVDGAEDFEFRMGTEPDVARGLSPAFEKLISKTPARGTTHWRIPEVGLLNPGKTYYWKVRARNGDGLWGPWSDVASFASQAPAVPGDVRLQLDWERRTATLRWRPGAGGRPAHHFEIYGSDERGFSVSREPYEVFQGGDDTAIVAANLLTTTTEREFVVIGADLDALSNKCFYRVVAVDDDGVRSGASDYAEAPRPFVYSRPPQSIAAATVSCYELGVVRSIGDLRCVSDGPRRYLSAFRDADELRFILDEGPPWIELDAQSGKLTFSPEARDAGTHTVTVRVDNGQGGVDVQGFDLEVIAS